MKPEQFRQITDEALGGLVAGPALFHRAKMRAAGQDKAVRQLPTRRALALAMSLVLLLGSAALILPRLQEDRIPVIGTLTAGNEADNLTEKANLPRGSLQLSRTTAPSQGIWEGSGHSNFPLLRMDGRYYRMLTNPTDASALVDANMGRVAVFAAEPALDNSQDILSNIAPQGATVYSFSGMGRAALAAQVDGQTRLFQRVSFAGNALLGSETLRDTLPRGAVALQITGLGTITDQETVDLLMDTLYQSAEFQGNETISGEKALLIDYGNGLVLQMNVKGDSFSACGTWYCPEFMEGFQKAVN